MTTNPPFIWFTSAVVSLCLASGLAYLLKQASTTSKVKESLQRERQRLRGSGVPERILILGCSSGIGRELALLYAKRGSSLLLVARRKALLDELMLECKSLSSNPTIHTCAGDITQEQDLLRIAQSITELMPGGGIDIVVINAGIMSMCTFYELCERVDANSVIEDMIKTNLFAPILVTKIFLPALIRSKGAFVVVSSVAAKLAAPTRALYSATKHGVNGFFHALRLEIQAKYGVDVCIAMPASVETQLQNKAVDAMKPGINDPSKPKSSGVFKRMLPVVCASAIMKGVDARDPWIYIPSWYWAVSWLQYFFPRWIDDMACKKYKV